MDIQKVKELVKEYPICQICKENGEDVQFNLYELVLETERLKREKEWLVEKYTKYLSETSQADTELAKKHILKSMQRAIKGGGNGKP